MEFLSNPTEGAGVTFPGGGGGGGLTNPLSETEPSTPASGVSIFARLMAGREMFGYKNVDGDLDLLQPHLMRNKVSMLLPSAGGTTPQSFGFPAITAVGTVRTPATTRFFTMRRRIGHVTSTTAGTSQGVRANVAEMWRGNAAGLGGFHFIARFGISHAVAVAQARGFVGIAPAAAFGNANPSTFLNQIGMQFDSAETTWRIGSNDGAGAATRVDLGANYPCNTLSVDWYELQLFCKPNDTKVEYAVARLNVPAQAPATGTITTDLPANTQLLAPNLWINNGTAAAAAAMDFGGFYLEMDN